MATNITAITDTSNSSVRNGGPQQFRAIFDEVIPFSFKGDDDTLAAQVGATCDITVTGAALGDFVLITPAVDNTDQLVYAQVTAANTVTVTTFNIEGTDAQTPFAANPTFYGVVLKRTSVNGPWVELTQ